jgi:hypothetical protein
VSVKILLVPAWFWDAFADLTCAQTAKMQELENYRSLDAKVSGTSETPTSQLIEERDVLEANIAV